MMNIYENKPEHSISIDVEDWFQVFYLEDIIDKNNWDFLESKINEMICHTLQIFNEYNVKCTFFCIGWLADKHPDLIKQIYKNGHEIACHSYWHRQLFNYQKSELRKDIERSKKTLEDITGDRIYGFRAPGYSINKNNEWVLDELVECGYKYDSSILYGDNKPFEIRKGLIEISPNSIGFGKYYLPSNGGFAFRMSPYFIYKFYVDHLIKNQKKLNFYLHSWEIYTDYPRLKIPVIKKFIQYYNLKNVKKKFVQLINNYKFTSIKNLYFKKRGDI